MRLDLLLDNVTVLTMDPARPAARAVGVWGGRIVGVDEELAGLPAEHRIDLAGATVLPGFIDAHTHLAWAGRSESIVDISGHEDPAAALSVIEKASQAAAPDAWVEVAGYDQRPFGRHLTRYELDAVADGRKVWLQHKSGHAAVVNSAVLALIGDDGVERDAAGEPTGVLLERALLALRAARLPYPEEELIGAIRTAMNTCLAQGVTMAVEAGIGVGLIGSGPTELGAYLTARESGRLPIRVQLMVAADSLNPEAGLDLGIRTGLGDDWLSVGPVKLWLDGGVMARTAALTEPFADGSGSGQLQDDPAAMTRVIRDAHRGGWQLAIHAIGDRAVDVALDALAAAQEEYPRPEARHRIEHCGIVRPDQLDRLAALRVLPVVQPEFLWHYGDDYAAVLGPVRAHWQYRGRSFTDRGLTLVGSSDRPVVAGAPLRGIQFMVQRLTNAGTPIGADEALTVEAALRAYTVGGAYATRRERTAGMIAAGRDADFTVLADDPRAVDPARLADIEVVATIVGGELRYGRLS